jgi:hypothetical protein
MKDTLVSVGRRLADVLFLVALCLSLLLAGGHVLTRWETGNRVILPGGARKVDLPLVWSKISNGERAEHQAMYFKKIPR